MGKGQGMQPSKETGHFRDKEVTTEWVPDEKAQEPIKTFESEASFFRRQSDEQGKTIHEMREKLGKQQNHIQNLIEEVELNRKEIKNFVVIIATMAETLRLEME
jgi:hypothetical protein